MIGLVNTGPIVWKVWWTMGPALRDLREGLMYHMSMHCTEYTEQFNRPRCSRPSVGQAYCLLPSVRCRPYMWQEVCVYRWPVIWACFVGPCSIAFFSLGKANICWSWNMDPPPWHSYFGSKQETNKACSELYQGASRVITVLYSVLIELLQETNKA